MGLAQSLPVTSYIKMIDIWMLFTMTVPFLEVVLHTTNEVFKRPMRTDFGFVKRVDVVRTKPDEDQEEEPETSNRVSSSLVVRLTGRIILPISSVIFTIIFWVVGLVVSYSSGTIHDPNMTDCLTNDLN